MGVASSVVESRRCGRKKGHPGESKGSDKGGSSKQGYDTRVTHQLRMAAFC